MNTALRLCCLLAFFVISAVNTNVFAQQEKQPHSHIKLYDHSAADFKQAVGVLESSEGIQVTQRIDPVIWFTYTNESARSAAIAQLQQHSISFDTKETVNNVDEAPHHKQFTQTPPSSLPQTSIYNRGGSYNHPGGTINTCGGLFYDTGGAIINYGSNQNIVTTFCPNTPGDCIKIDFTSFRTEANYDKLIIYDGPTTASPQIGTYSGTTSPGAVGASEANPSGCLTFEFISDGSVSYAGWEATISCGTCLPDPNAPIITCDDTFYDTGGSGADYSSGENYTVTYCPDSSNECIQAAFSSFATENCCDYLRIYDGPNTSAPLIGQYQGSNNPGTILGSIANASGCLTFEFHSDGSVTYAGWAAAISCETCGPDPNAPIITCDDTFYDTGGSGGNYNSSANYTATYCPDSPDECIQAAFSSFATESCCDYLRIYDGPNTSAPLIGQYQGTNNPGIIIGTLANATGCLTFEFISDGSVTYAGWAAAISCSECGFDPNAPIITCDDTFYDTGGGGGNYGSNENYTVTYCPDSSDECIQAAFSSFATESCCDYLRIYDGPNTGAPLIGQYLGANNPGIIIGTLANASGCLTFEFFSDGSVPYAGWAAAISCSECGTPPPAPPQDCNGGITICSDETFDGNSGGNGIQELTSSNKGCMSTEHQSSWFLFSPQSTGTIAFMITPTPLVDYDFAIWGPYDEPTCPPPGLPLRCSWAAPSVPTGLQAGAGDNTEGAGGNGVVNPIVVGPAEVGKVYILLIDNFSATTTPFNFNWNLGGGLSLDCSVLPVELLSFTGEHQSGVNVLNWKTASEQNSDYFELQRSDNGIDYQTLGTVPAQGHSGMVKDYSYTDTKPTGQHYYQLKQVDFNGDAKRYGPVVINLQGSGTAVLPPFPNPVVDGLLHIPFNLVAPDEVTCQIINLTGQVLLQRKIELSAGNHQVDLNLESIASGMYHLRITDNAQRQIYSAKVVK